MVLKSTSADVSVYQISGTNTSRSLPDWLARKRKRSLKNDPDYANRVELIQDFEFSEASNRIKVSKDGQYIMATGTYKPQIHVYDLAQLGLKFERHTDTENVDFIMLSDDWTKSVHLQNDRSIEFQTQGGLHYRSRIPKFGRCLNYNPESCDLYVGASSNELYRLNLDQGRFLAPFQLDSEGVNCIDVNKAHGLVSVGTDEGTVEFWDPRSRNRVNQLSIGPNPVTALASRFDGLNLGVGEGEGQSYIFDLRSSAPLLRKDQGYGFPIIKMLWIDTDNGTLDGTASKVLTADKRIVKLWDRVDGSPYTSMEPTVDINDVDYIPKTGMFFLANEGMPMHTYYIPSIGTAPKWCSFLDNITEELEEKPTNTVYSNYKFVTRKELEQLNLTSVIGTKVARSYMHGFFIDQELYEKARLIANPFAYKEHREREIKKRIEKERESRIRTAANAPKVKVNKALAEKIGAKTNTNVSEKGETPILQDNRFAKVFEDEEFEVDVDSHEYRLLNPSGAKQVPKEPKLRESARPLTAAEEEEEERLNGKDSESSDESESESEDEFEKEQRLQREIVKKRLAEERMKRKAAEKAKIQMVEADTKQISSRSESFDTAVAKQEAVMQEKLEKRKNMRVRKGPMGEVEVSFVPQKKAKKVQFQEKSVKDSGKEKQVYEGRRRASKNAFRGM